jgi:23S rRNA (cytidine1920-2'-O)/16S rRNA (cytidine1409-2'-O)-methyltransferase
MAETPRAKRPAKARADQLLVEQGLAVSREQARALLLAGEVFSGTQRIERPGQSLPAGTPLRVRERPRFVGRGGEKLAGALDAFGLEVRGLVALDVGASTGGFVDCLLQGGAARVYAVDVGHGQLAVKLRDDPRVVSMEGVNARDPFPLPEPVDLVVTDVSFISLRLVLPAALEHLRAGGQALVLVKPQFEAGREQVGRGGIVRDPAVHAQVVGGFCLWAIERGLRLEGVRPSPIEGGDGNREFFVLLHA